MKRLLRDVRERILWILPDWVLFYLENHLNNSDLRGYVQKIRLDRFIERTDFERLDVQHMPVCSIQKGDWDYPLFQMCFLNDMIGRCIYCLSRGYLPRVDFVNNEGINLWEQFLVQPFEQIGGGNSRYINDASCVCEAEKISFSPPVFMNSADIDRYYKVYKTFIRLNEETKQYFEEEYNTVLSNHHKAIGVLCRGTDYTANKPKYHPIQPDMKEVIEMLSAKMEEYGCEYIYLATEEEAAYRRLDEAFPGRILTNKRRYFDAFYALNANKPDSRRISGVRFDRERDSYYKSLEYCSSLYLLSRCDLLIAGNTGGSRIAAYMNHNRYEYMHLFNKGLY